MSTNVSCRWLTVKIMIRLLAEEAPAGGPNQKYLVKNLYMWHIHANNEVVYDFIVDTSEECGRNEEASRSKESCYASLTLLGQTSPCSTLNCT